MDRLCRGVDDDFGFVVCRSAVDESSHQSTATLVGRLHDCLFNGMTRALLIDGTADLSKCWNLVVVGFIFAMHSCGMGIHADLLDPADIVMMAKWLVVAEILYAFNLGWTKISLLMMYYRIFHLPYFKKMAWAVGSFVMVWVVTITFLFIFICVPVAKMWYPELPGKCINQVATWIANAASTIFTDLIILLMPLPPVWGLKLGKREKIGLTAAFGLGSLYVYPVLQALTRGCFG